MSRADNHPITQRMKAKLFSIRLVYILKYYILLIPCDTMKL
jgi:hypothetical protein